MSDLVIRESYEGGYDHGNLNRAEIREGFGKHQIGIFDYPVPDSDFIHLAPELTPMAFRWGVNPDGIRTFYGYVNHHEMIDGSDGPLMRFYCIGSSQSLNQPWPTSWRNVTGSYIARLVAERHGLRALVHNSKSILPYWTPGQGNDFEMMNRLAEETGFRFWVDGATLFFVDPQVLLTSPDRSLAASYEFNRNNNDTLIGIRSINGSMAPVASAPAVQRVFGLDANGRMIKASSSQQLSDKGLPRPVNTQVYPKAVSSLAEAHRINESASVAGNWASVQATTYGDGRARVGGLVEVAGLALNKAYQGVWVASDITHVLDSTTNSNTWQYTAQIELIRNQKDQAYFSTHNSMKDTLAEVPAVLRSGRWESSILESVYV